MGAKTVFILETFVFLNGRPSLASLKRVFIMLAWREECFLLFFFYLLCFIYQAVVVKCLLSAKHETTAIDLPLIALFDNKSLQGTLIQRNRIESLFFYITKR